MHAVWTDKDMFQEKVVGGLWYRLKKILTVFSTRRINLLLRKKNIRSFFFSLHVYLGFSSLLYGELLSLQDSLEEKRQRRDTFFCFFIMAGGEEEEEEGRVARCQAARPRY